MNFEQLSSASQSELLSQVPEEVKSSIIESTRDRLAIKLCVGNKVLTLSLDNDGNARSYIENIGDNQLPFPGVTTKLYSIAMDILQKAADCTGQNIEYVFRTKAPNMKEWLKLHEKKFFDRIRPNPDPYLPAEGWRTVKPQTQTL